MQTAQPPNETLLILLVPFLVAFVLGLLLMPPYIRWVKSRQIEQYLREDGPASHAAKAKTPTMGGVGFILASVLTMFAWWLGQQTVGPVGHVSIDAILVFVVAVLCALVGFADDYAKVTQKSNKGVSGKIRLAAEGALGLVLGIGLGLASQSFGRVILCLASDQTATQLSGLPLKNIAFLKGDVVTGQLLQLDIPMWPIWLCLVSMFLIAATTNAVNLHDGMDGLAAGTSAQVFGTLAVLLYETHQYSYASIAACAAGAIVSFLVFNKHPAKIFMGDTGSLFIGGLIGALVSAGGLVLWFVPLSLIYIIETISVIIQVGYFKLTKPFKPEKPMSPLMVLVTKLTKRLPGEGKRFFRMAPLHHHFEAVLAEKGIGESRVVLGFWLAQFLLCFLVIALFYALKS